MQGLERFHVGCSGWYYRHWEGVLYPPGTDKSKYFEYYCKAFRTVEINSTFYKMPFRGYVKGWVRKAPSGFVYAVKMNRRITHENRLKDVDFILNDFLGRIKPLKDAGKLGPILVQLPPGLHRDDGLLERFLSILPRGYEYAVEFRHRSWFEGEVLRLLERYGVAFCVVSAPRMPSMAESTCDFAYVRFHGVKRWYNYNYSREELQQWANRISKLPVQRVYIYFNNDPYGYAVRNAKTMIGLLSHI
ncbi:MAG TPA: DUF72 domain-containing protein [Candidatus Bathyarchaeota archaeon]|nr:DUF72 domain-containing protein [Candidatus Bathyarchaeota archaeon]